MSQIRVPVKITPDPIVDSIVEFRFASIHQKEKLIPLLLNHFSSPFPFFRDSLPQIGFSSEYATRTSLHNSEFAVNVGPNVVSFACLKDYRGWSAFSAIIRENMISLASQNLIGDIERVGLRYVNFFKNVMLLSQNINLDITFAGREHYKSRTASLRTELQKDNFSFNVIIADNVIHNNSIPGSILDIDVTTEPQKLPFSEKVMGIVDQLHLEEKTLFYSLLKNEFLQSFNPEYK